ncbi:MULTISPECIES: hypothetical protein [unclassified Aliivibrio]|uniref:hypothetical protein n=1 Tax=unclassified Aliivibrio TaxID=2645654 RepID=UPI00080E2BA5|nr:MULTISPECIES: hypothetical protein [unclassified Aliivibrio]OCH19047.1 hypothetical protein A6E05_01465 [Aliivibrio sp. 1S165]OCH19923.1 hypothetical protein A6E03_11430 [Aliivibrio sp. 1S128]OCH30759.1 hypothetical protein A6E06_04045 [Aliivibrio sp. 1S175]
MCPINSNTLIIRDLSHNRKALETEEEEKLEGSLLSDDLCLTSILTTNKYIRHLRAMLKREYWRTHDFRRSLSTGISALGVMSYECYAEKLILGMR